MTLAGGVMFWCLACLSYCKYSSDHRGNIILYPVPLYHGWLGTKKYSERLEKFNREMDNHGKNYLLTLRLIPIFPFFMINLAAGMTKIPLLTFIWTTSIGTIPGTFAYTLAGNNLSNIESPSEILSKEILLVFVVLGIISLVPTMIQKKNENRRSFRYIINCIVKTNTLWNKGVFFYKNLLCIINYKYKITSLVVSMRKPVTKEIICLQDVNYFARSKRMNEYSEYFTKS